jgi:putative tricarboxylic transport membrane protein
MKTGDNATIPSRRWSAHSVVAAALFLGAAAAAHAQQGGWRPEKPVEIVIPSAAGSSLDAAARMIQRIMQEARLVDVPVIVVNRTGGGGGVAQNYLDQRAGDPHYLFLSTMSLLNNHILGRAKTNWTDYSPIATLFSEDMTLIARSDSPFKSGRDVMEQLRKDPQSVSFAVGFTAGGTGHLNVAMVATAMGVDAKRLKTVQFQGNAQALAALLGGHVDLSSMSFAQAWRASQQGNVRILGVASGRRGDGPLADLPTWKEQGFDIEFANTRIMFGTKGIGQQQAEYWDAILQKVLGHDLWKAFAAKNHYKADYTGHKDSPKRLAALYDSLRKALVSVGLAK